MSEFWDSRYDGQDYVYGLAPNTHLVAQFGHLNPGGRVLVPGDGEGRNGVWLATQGMDVLSVDQSAVGLEKARHLAATKGVSIATEQADLEQWSWPVASFDGVVSIFLHFAPDVRTRMHRAMAATLKPGGVIILEVFRPEQLGYSSGGPKDAAMLYRSSDLLADFAGLDMVLLEDADVVLDEGTFHRGPGAVVRMVARRR